MYSSLLSIESAPKVCVKQESGRAAGQWAQWKTRAADLIGRVKGAMEQLYDWLVRVQD